MFQNMSLMDVLLKGGPVFYLMVVISLFSISIIIERAIAFSSIKKNARTFMSQIQSRLRNGRLEEAASLCADHPGIIADIVLSALERRNQTKEVVVEAVERSGAKLANYLDTRMYILATAASATPFIGLFGTVIGIINAFNSISSSESYSPALVSNGIAEALVNTAAGLFVAVPAVIAYNWLTQRGQVFMREVEIFGSEMIEHLSLRSERQ